MVSAFESRALCLVIVTMAVFITLVTEGQTLPVFPRATSSRPYARPTYQLTTNMSGNSFFDNFYFYSGADYTHGTVDYVTPKEAQDMNLISVLGDGKIYIGADYWSKIAPGDEGRPAVRLESLKTWDKALFVMDVEHVPTGCGTWPTWWLLGQDWPNQGEVDIIEGVNNVQHNTATLHTSRGCSMPPGESDDDDDPEYFSGGWGTGRDGDPARDCWVENPDQFPNQGCGIAAERGTLGPKLNKRKGGVFAFEWTDRFMKTWYFRRENIPQDLKAGMNPDPSSWEKPFAYFPLGPYNCAPSTFGPQQMIINLTFCGDYSGYMFEGQCPEITESCDSYVRNNPSAFLDAYWLINSVNVYELNTAQTVSPPPASPSS